MKEHFRPFLAELIGSFAFVFVSAGAVCTSQLTFTSGSPQSHLLAISLATGAMLTVLLPATLHLAGGLLNPAITLTLWVFRRVEAPRVYWILGGQFTGAFLAGLALRLMFSPVVLNEAQFGAPHLNVPAFGGVAGHPTPGILMSGIGIEFVLTFILTFVIYATLLDSRAPQLGILAAGLTLTGLTLMAYPLTGAAVNPARWLGPWLWELTLRPDAAIRDHVVYWVGPPFGALAAGLVYEYVFWPKSEQKGATPEPSATESGSPVTSTLFRKK